jgi:hypothetical protein
VAKAVKTAAKAVTKAVTTVAKPQAAPRKTTTALQPRDKPAPATSSKSKIIGWGSQAFINPGAPELGTGTQKTPIGGQGGIINASGDSSCPLPTPPAGTASPPGPWSCSPAARPSRSANSRQATPSWPAIPGPARTSRDRHRRPGPSRHRPVRPEGQGRPQHRGHPHHRRAPVLGPLSSLLSPCEQTIERRVSRNHRQRHDCHRRRRDHAEAVRRLDVGPDGPRQQRPRLLRGSRPF